ncbi:hypothetical protein MKX03_014859 [Papaver bracteatum]|nr:hypothetical protein MKX03_014859 [Papaver bracteatum]
MMTEKAIWARTYRHIFPETNSLNPFQYTQNSRQKTDNHVRIKPPCSRNAMVKLAHNSATLSSTTTSVFRAHTMASNGGGGEGNRSDGVKDFKLSLSSSLMIQRGDITMWSVNGTSDAIVNAANEKMLGGGGVDGAIHRAAGPELGAACYTVPEVRPGIRCPKGEAKITPAFQLPVFHVIHVVGPVYHVDNHPEVTLRNAYRNCLKLAKENKIEYIAFPAISCGAYGYPYDQAAGIAISTVMESDGDFKEVHFVLFEDDVYDAWLNKANALL